MDYVITFSDVMAGVIARVAVGDINDKYSDYPSNGLTPGRLARIFRQADEGDVRAQMELFEEMEEKDTHLFSQMQTRKLAVTGLDWEVQPFSKDDRDKEIADFVDEQLKSIENFDNVLIDMLTQPVAIITPINILEIFIRPFSLCLRLFGNVLGAFVIMELIKAVVPMVVPLVFSFYFDIFDGLIQAYVFVFLTSLYIKEAIELQAE